MKKKGGGHHPKGRKSDASEASASGSSTSGGKTKSKLQNISEKGRSLFKKDPVFHSEQLQELYKTHKQCVVDLQQLYKRIDKLANSYANIPSETRNIELLLTTVSDRAPSSQAMLKEGCNLLESISNSQQSHIEYLRSNVLSQITTLRDTQIQAAKESIKECGEQLKEYEDVKNKTEKAAKKGTIPQLEAQSTVRRALSTYEVVEGKLTHTLKAVNETCDRTFGKVSDALLESYEVFWTRTQGLSKKIHTSIASHRAEERTASAGRKEQASKRMTVFGRNMNAITDAKCPEFVSELIQFIQARGLDEEGLFRVPGNMDMMQQLKAKINAGMEWKDELKKCTVHDACGLLKLYFRDLPEVFIPFGTFDLFMGTLEMDSAHDRLVATVKSVNALSPVVYATLKELVHLCVLISARAEINKMTPLNVARSLAPGLMHAEHEDPKEMVVMAKKTNAFFASLVEGYQVIFENPLYALAAAGDVTAFEELATEQLVFTRDETGRNVLHYAAERGAADMIQYLRVKYPEDDMPIDSRDNFGKSPLYLACEKGHLQAALVLVGGGAILSSSDNERTTVRAMALKNHGPDFVAKLVARQKQRVREENTQDDEQEEQDKEEQQPASEAPSGWKSPSPRSPREPQAQLVIDDDSSSSEGPPPEEDEDPFADSDEVVAVAPKVVQEDPVIEIKYPELWERISSEPFFAIKELGECVLEFSSLVSAASGDQEMDRSLLGSALKNIARAISIFFKCLPDITSQVSDSDAEAVRSAGAKLKASGSAIVVCVRELAGASASEQAATNFNSAALELAQAVIKITDRIELGKYRMITGFMKKTGEAAASLVKASSQEQVEKYNVLLEQNCLDLGSAVITRILKTTSANIQRATVKSIDDLVRQVDTLITKNTAAERGACAKTIILGFRGIKATMKSADTVVTSETRTDEEVYASIRAILRERNLGHPLLKSLSALVEASEEHFGQWNLFVEPMYQFVEVMCRIQVHLNLKKRALLAGSQQGAASNLSFLIEALEYHQVRMTTLTAHAAIQRHTEGVDIEMAQSLRPCLALDGLVNMILACEHYF